jgi:hypothetical protein
MAEIRINGKRFPTLQSVDNLGTLVNKLDQFGVKEGSCLTNLSINGIDVDIDNPEMFKMRLDTTDVVESLMESAEQLALQSLQVAQEMAELLVFDIKVATLNLWENTRTQSKNLETLVRDCNLFLTLASRPVELLGRDPRNVEKPIEECLRLLDRIANGIEATVLLATRDQQKDACRIMVSKVMPNIESWLQATEAFSEKLNLTNFEFNVAGASSASRESIPAL